MALTFAFYETFASRRANPPDAGKCGVVEDAEHAADDDGGADEAAAARGAQENLHPAGAGAAAAAAALGTAAAVAYAQDFARKSYSIVGRRLSPTRLCISTSFAAMGA